MWLITKTNKEQTRQWEEQGYIFEAKKGVPNKVDILFLYYFMFKLYQNNWVEEFVLTRYEVLKGCGIYPGQERYNRLVESLDKWANIEIFPSAKLVDGGAFNSSSFCVIRFWNLQANNKKLIIKFDKDWISKIKDSSFYKFIDFEELKKLKAPLVFRVYELLSGVLYGRATWEIDVLDFAKKIPMAEKYISNIIPKIQAATRKIKDKTSLNISVETIRHERGYGSFIFKKSPPKKKAALFPKQKVNPSWKKVSKEETKKILSFLRDNPFSSHEACSKEIDIDLETVDSCVARLLKSHIN